MPKTVILVRRPHARRQARRRPRSLDATELGGIAIKAALERAGVEPEQVAARRHGPGAPGRPGADPVAPGPDQGRDPQGGLLRDDQQGLRLGHPRRRHPRHRDPRRRRSRSASAAAWSRCRSAPYLLPQARFGFRMGDGKALDAMIHDGLTNPFSGKHMAQEATEVGDELEMTRADMDRWALRSHERAIAATDEGRLPEEIVPVTVKGKKGDTVVEVDEAPRRDTTPRDARQAAADLPARTARHTAGNSPGVNDGGGALVLASDEWAQRQRQGGRWPRSSPRRAVADDFAYLARTPANAAEKALEKAGPDGRATSTCGRSTRRSPR